MVAPTTYVVSILVNDVEVVSFVPFSTMSFDDNARDVSYFRFTIENPSGVTPARAQTVVITNGAIVIFDGFIMALETKKRDNGIKIEYVIEAADKKVLLQKSVLDYNELSGSDASILSSLLSNTYPDLTDDFDFGTGVDSYLSDMDFNVGDDSLLDALNGLSDLAGGANWRFDNVAGGDATITFDDGGAAYTIPVGSQGGVTTGGNPDNCVAATGVTLNQYVSVEFDLGESKSITDFNFDYFVTDRLEVTLELYVDSFLAFNNQIFATSGAWETRSGLTVTETGQVIEIRLVASDTQADMRIDNIEFPGALTGGDNTPELQWGLGADATDFDLDIQSGDEFALDIDLFEGDFDDFNSITVIGGKEEVSVVWTYESDGDLDHFALELPIKNIVIDKNTGTDGSPIWTTQDDGIFGTDLLSSQGGSKEILYDPEKAWLWFNNTPPNLSKSIRVSGEIERPVRVRVEDVASGDRTYATTHFDDSVKSQEEAVALGQSLLDKRNAISRVTFKTYEPTLKPGQSINIADSARGLDETLTITNIQTKWIGASGHALFTVTCGEDDLPSADILIANNDKRSRKNATPAATTTATINFLFDTDGSKLFDTDGKTLFEAT